MDDQNKKNPYDDFFGQRNTENGSAAGEASADAQANEPAKDAAKPSYYYSYGPFKSTPQGGENAVGGRSVEHASERERRPYSASEAQHGVEITPAAPPAVYEQPLTGHSTSKVNAGWQVRETRRSSFRAIFASFMAGVIVVGGLMFASDRLNWFSGADALAVQSGSPLSSSSGGEASIAAGSGGAAPVANALDVVRPNNIAKVFEQSSPAVVKIETYVQGRSAGNGSSLFDDPFFRQFFGDELQQPNNQGGQSNQLVPNGLGSGFFFDKTGYILTNQHVIGDADRITVTVQGYDEPLEAKLLGSSYELDLAVLKVEGDKDFPTLALGDSNTINVGEWVVAIGNPNGFDHTVTVGVLSAKERPISIPDAQGTRNYEHLLQTDASINPGNSGGPLINLNGEVIGINTAVSTQAQGIGFAIPTSTIKEVLEHVKNNQAIPKAPVPFIGAELGVISEEIAKQLGLPDTNGSIVANITYNSPAFKADLRQYDVITGMDGKKYNARQELIAAIQKKNVGDQVTLDVIRGGKSIELPVTIGNRNDFNLQQ
jgi:serine protease Do